MFHKVKEVIPMEDFIIEIVFQDKTRKKYNVKQLFEKWDIFKKLMNDEYLFKQVKVDNGGYGISWNDEIDLSCNELWENGYE